MGKARMAGRSDDLKTMPAKQRDIVGERDARRQRETSNAATERLNLRRVEQGARHAAPAKIRTYCQSPDIERGALLDANMLPSSAP